VKSTPIRKVGGSVRTTYRMRYESRPRVAVFFRNSSSAEDEFMKGIKPPHTANETTCYDCEQRRPLRGRLWFRYDHRRRYQRLTGIHILKQHESESKPRCSNRRWTLTTRFYFRLRMHRFMALLGHELKLTVWRPKLA
jgi:hypothetical protein